MLKYAVKRILLAIVTVFIIAAITFFAMNAIPGGPFDKEKAPEPEVQAVLEARFHLDKPVYQQFFLYLGDLMHGDFGVSLKTGRDISATIQDSFYISAKLGGMAILWAVVLGLVL
ncbi:MAG: ABC transporter permease, partial [Clostridia bacterium]